MKRMGFKRKLRPFEVLDVSELKAIRGAIDQVLIKTGITVEDAEAQRFLEAHGCTVDQGNNRVRFTERIIHEALDHFPKSFGVAARDPENNWLCGHEDFTYIMSSNGMGSVDLETWQQREPTRKEFYDYMRVLDYLPHAHGIQTFPWFGFARVPTVMRMLENLAAKIRMSSKVTSEGSVKGNDRWAITMCQVVGMDLIMLVNPVAPLTLNRDSTEKIFRFTSADVPFLVNSGPMGGASAPATIAGSMTSCAAEHIAAMVYSHLVKPGARIFSNYMSMLQNMRTGAPFFAQVGNMLHDAANTQLWRSYGIPIMTSSPSWTNSKKIDFQAGYETAMAAAFSAISGATVIKFLGGLTQQLSAHPIKAIMDNDVAGMIIRFMGGITVNEETIALEVIDKVGPLPGQFLSTSHTLKWWKSEQYIPDVADLSSMTGWAKNGGKVMFDNALEKYRAILENHRPLPLTPQQEQEIEHILKDARGYYKDNGMISEEEWHLYQEDLASPDYPYA